MLNSARRALRVMLRGGTLTGLLCLVLAVGFAIAAEDGVVADPSQRPAPPALPADWSLPAPGFVQQMIYPAQSGDHVLVVNSGGDAVVWSLSQKKPIRTIDAKVRISKNELAALSVDGERVAIAADAYSSGVIDVWNITTGKYAHRLDTGSDGERRVGFVEFAGPRKLVSYPGKQGKSSLALWDLDTGDLLKTLLTPVELVRETVAVSPGGRYLAVAGLHKNLLLLYDLQSGQLVRQMMWHTSGSGGFWDDCKALAFSPDGRELAALFAGKPSGYLRVWDLVKDELVIDSQIQAEPFANLRGMPSYSGRRLTWFPDGSGWLCFGYYWVDRATLQTLMTLRIDGAIIVPEIHPIVRDRVLFHSPQPNPALRLAVLPQLTAPDPNVKPMLQRGDAVRLQIDVGDLRTDDKGTVVKSLSEAFTQRLAQLGLTVQDDAPLTLIVKYAESAGPMVAPQRGVRLPTFGASRTPSDEPGQGTGFIVSPTGLVATCAHVVGKSPDMTVQIGEKKHAAKVLARDAKLDLALLKFDATDLLALRLRDSAQFELGEDVRAVGYPLTDVLGNSLKVTKGSVSGIVKKDEQTFFMIDAVVNPGNSGGPLIDGKGRVLGVNSAKLIGPAVERIGLSIPTNLLRKFASDEKIEIPADQEAPALEGADLVRRLEATVVMVLPPGASTTPVASTTIACQLEWRHRDRAEPIWQTKLTSQSGGVVQGTPLTEQALRQEAFRVIETRIAGALVPYYISADGTQTIPGVVELKQASGG